jgi:hypothetical protein
MDGRIPDSPRQQCNREGAVHESFVCRMLRSVPLGRRRNAVHAPQRPADERAPSGLDEAGHLQLILSCRDEMQAAPMECWLSCK